ncbi:MAG: fused MFS/spermidine synthase [Clostridia bacterium]|nr:fused MFS/spermidine synthase [Clostridia bacterium]
MKKYRIEIILFVVEAVCMILELVASRILSPYFGSSNLVWTSVIGIILASGSIGNYLGGIVADKPEVNKKFKLILLISGILIFIIPFIQTPVIEAVSILFKDIRIGAIISTVFLFFLPSVFLGFLVPMVQKLKITNLENSGEVSGKVYALATLGGIFGTFIGGFWLVPSFGSIEILFFMVVAILVLIPLVDFKIEKKELLFIIISLIILISAMYIYSNKNTEKGEKVLAGKVNEYVSYDTEYSRILVFNRYDQNNDLVRSFTMDSGHESATYVDESRWNELVFEYTKMYDLMFKSSKEIKDTLLIGGAGYSYPKHYISKYLDKSMDVVEIDPMVTEIAKKYFYLDKLIDEYKTEENNRLKLITEDGRTYLNNNTKKYDAILNDAFSDTTPAATLTTLEAVKNIKKSLNENGLYLTNIISSLEGENSKFMKAEVKTLKEVFLNVYVIPCITKDDLELPQNNMVIATDGILEIDKTKLYNLEIGEEDIILTDNYCPIDTLIPQH